jgi:CBS-domain-containing membrane protein
LLLTCNRERLPETGFSFHAVRLRRLERYFPGGAVDVGFVPTVSPDESVNRVMNLMTHHRVRHMPVLRGGKLAGIVSIGDVVKHRLEELELETNVLRDAYNAAR